ncbi:hypothetical protein K469DRAFT_717503 [Zopfia rhizophila CBS 207.26]|uniref:Uncharacterized protein n=1 Tax=Zopfia rhizophila CBS 207.26 TaxID=1314779 RepID=A0A6A6DM25_9PEZI|nr:hypothetical protein K469DRAFT_717503 [Zopfia rhizophila CBS 207.26]
MAAAEYFYGTAGAQALQNQSRPNPYPPLPQYPSQQSPPQSNQPLQNYNSPPPSYSPYPPQQNSYPPQPPPGPPPTSAPYPHTPPNGPANGQYARPPAQGNGLLVAPVQHHRSHSQPPRVRFKDEKYDSDDSTVFSPSDSDRSPHQSQHRRRKHHHSHSHHHHIHSRSSSYSPDRERDRARKHKPRTADRKDRKTRDTFLGAGGGAIIGDVIFPGLGTAAGLLLGGYGGRKHAEKRSRSETPRDRDEHRDFGKGRSRG